MSKNNNTIHQQLTKLLMHNMTLSDFRQWFITSEASDAEHSIVYEIKLLFAEYDHGDWSDDEMMMHLRAVLAD